VQVLIEFKWGECNFPYTSNRDCLLHLQKQLHAGVYIAEVFKNPNPKLDCVGAVTQTFSPAMNNVAR